VNVLRLLVIAAAAAGLTACGGSSASKGGGDGDVASAIASVRDALGTDRIVDAEVSGSRLTVSLRRADGPGDATVSLWYGKLLARAVVDRLGGDRISSAVYEGASEINVNGGADRRFRAAAPPDALPAGICARVAHDWAESAAATVSQVEQIGVLGGACLFVVRPQDVEGFVADAGGLVSGLRSLPGGPNARPTLIEVVDGKGAPKFVLYWIPDFGGGIGQGGAWVQPGLRSSAILGQPAPISVP